MNFRVVLNKNPEVGTAGVWAIRSFRNRWRLSWVILKLLRYWAVLSNISYWLQLFLHWKDVQLTQKVADFFLGNTDFFLGNSLPKKIKLFEFFWENDRDSCEANSLKRKPNPVSSDWSWFGLATCYRFWDKCKKPKNSILISLGKLPIYNWKSLFLATNFHTKFWRAITQQRQLLEIFSTTDQPQLFVGVAYENVLVFF